MKKTSWRDWALLGMAAASASSAAISACGGDDTTQANGDAGVDGSHGDGGADTSLEDVVPVDAGIDSPSDAPTTDSPVEGSAGCDTVTANTYFVDPNNGSDSAP